MQPATQRLLRRARVATAGLVVAAASSTGLLTVVASHTTQATSSDGPTSDGSSTGSGSTGSGYQVDGGSGAPVAGSHAS
ncbi:hypothetical protein GCM10023340_09620 [Nocardioides marinquilinus]|uniref:Uncharacterized protein n=1 Tax=Nocardioides marinquilinus TaxID=1210400 RepID=A0ABP9PBF1_9ACTN